MTQESRAVISGRVLAVTDQAVKVRGLLADAWIPRSQILDSRPEIEELKEGKEATLVTRLWIARAKGLIE